MTARAWWAADAASLASLRIIDINSWPIMMSEMRTTLTIDDDLMSEIEDLRRREGISLKAAINQLLREGMRHRGEPRRAKPYKVKTRRLGLRAGVDATKLNQLVDELEAETFVPGVPGDDG